MGSSPAPARKIYSSQHLLDHDPNFLGHAKNLFLEMLDKGIDQALLGNLYGCVHRYCLPGVLGEERGVAEEDGAKVLGVMMAKEFVP